MVPKDPQRDFYSEGLQQVFGAKMHSNATTLKPWGDTAL